jgi:hypothetical protein
MNNPVNGTGQGRALNDQQLQTFLRDGFVRVPAAFSDQVAADCVAEVNRILIEEQGLDPTRPTKARYGVDRCANPEFDKLITPALVDVFDQLAGGNYWDREHVKTHGNFWLTFPGFHGTVWKAPRATGRWHIDLGYESRDAFELHDGNCAFVPAFLLTTSPERAAPTLAIRGSHKVIARLLAAADEPIERFAMVAFCDGLAMGSTGAKDIVPLVGDAGDVVIMHPYLIHAASGNTTQQIRIMGNTGIGFRGQKRLVGDEPASVIEMSIRSELENVRRRGKAAGHNTALLKAGRWVWKARNKLHGNMPNAIDIQPTFLRAILEKSLRPVQAGISALIAARL